MRVSSFNQRFTVALLATAALLSAACGEVARTGRSPAYLVVERLEAASGAKPGEFGGNLLSDVVTIVKGKDGETDVFVPTYFNDIGRAEFRIGLKDPGPATSPTTGSPLNAITLTRFRVVFTRSDGRNTQGVDVPYAIDGGMTLTVPAAGTASGTFNIVRNTAKLEQPLLGMGRGGGAQIMTVNAEVTFFGRDQAGNDVSVSSAISITFADFGDPLN